MPNKKNIVLFFAIYSLFCFLSLNRHSQAKPNTYHAEIWADKAGYNVYLPALFIYDFNASTFPHQLEAHTGYGFTLDSLSKKVVTKYPYAVALMQSPFWLLAHVASSQKDGYSLFYQKSIDFAGSFYLTLGLFFLYSLVRRYQTTSLSILLTLLIALSTGIFYYGIYETGMSHIYSFCCLAIILYLLTSPVINVSKLISIVFLSLLFVVIRPINVLFLIPIIISIAYKTKKISTILHLLNVKIIVTCLLITFLLILPQLVYYKYAFGSFFTMSYKNEPFVTPNLYRIVELLFSPNNGLLIYYPVLIVLFVFYFMYKQLFNALPIGLLWLYIMIYAAWWSLSLGCGFGHRAMNDIIIVFFLPFIFSDRKISKLFIGCLIICALINLKFILSFDTCLHFSTNWNYQEYVSIVFGEFK